MLTLRLAWRNLWRNSRRSLLNVSAIATAFVFLVLFLAMAQGVKEQLLENGTSLLLGHAQLHHPEYLPDRNLYQTLGGEEGVSPGDLAAFLEGWGIRAYSERVYGFALLSTGERSVGTQLMGLRPERERQVSRLLEHLTEGVGALEPGRRGLWLGETLARELRAELGSEVAVLTQAADGSLGNDLFFVQGFLKTGLAHLDRSLAVTHLEDLQDLLALPRRRIHEVALKLVQVREADRVVAALNQSGRLPPLTKVSSWGELAPQLQDYVRLSESASWILISFVGLFAALGVLNTMMMAVFERTREIGLVAALGMSPRQIVQTILMESVFLGMGGVATGFFFSLGLMSYLQRHGLDLSRWTGQLSMMNTHLDPVLRFLWTWRDALGAGAGLFLAALLAGLLPARRAARLQPVKALTAPTHV